MSRSIRRAFVGGALACGLCPLVALARIDTFDIEELFSNADGSVQFIELIETNGLNGQDQFEGAWMTATWDAYPFAYNLPSGHTAYRHVLIATEGFADLPGGVLPDYIMPANFITMKGDQICLGNLPQEPYVHCLAFGAGELPTDGLHSLNKYGGIAPNSPTNFAGETGSLKLATAVPSASRMSLMVLAALLLAGGIAVLGRNREIPHVTRF